MLNTIYQTINSLLSKWEWKNFSEVSQNKMMEYVWKTFYFVRSYPKLTNSLMNHLVLYKLVRKPHITPFFVLPQYLINELQGFFYILLLFFLIGNGCSSFVIPVEIIFWHFDGILNLSFLACTLVQKEYEIQ